MKQLLVTLMLLSACRSTTDVKAVRPAGKPVDAMGAMNREELEAHPASRRIHDAAQSFYQGTLLPSGFNGGILVAHRGRIVFESYAGRERLDTGDPMDTSSALHLASVSKTFTAMAVLKLQEQGRLDIGDSVARHLPGFPYPDVRIVDLLNHRSGIPNYVHFMESLGWDTQRVLTNRDLLDFITRNRQRIPVQKPDRYFEYSNTNYALLALVIEQAGGMSYAEYLRQHIFRPTGMNNTYVFSMDKADYAIPSFDHRGRPERITWLDAVYGDKNIYSTPRDLLRWDRALADHRLFRAESLEAAFKPYSHERPGVRNYGLGWRLLRFPQGSRLIFHNGWWHGNNTVFGRMPDDSATVIVLGNRYNRSIYKSRSIYASILGLQLGTEDDE
jgi:CubicO group peptidase (beta-lactamase class C family)